MKPAANHSSPPARPRQLQHKHKHGQASPWCWHLTEILCSVSIMCVYLDCKIFPRENTVQETQGNQDKPFQINIPLRELPAHPSTHTSAMSFAALLPAGFSHWLAVPPSLGFFKI